MSFKSLKKITAILSIAWLFSPLLALAMEKPTEASVQPVLQQVVQIDYSPAIRISSASPKFSDIQVVHANALCQAGGREASNLVQEPSSLNLNQSADCFVLNLGVLETQKYIAVTPLQANFQIKVVSQPVLSPWNFAPFHPVNQIPVATASLVVLLLAYLISVFAPKYILPRRSPKLAYNFFNIYYLNILRC
jgi:hypothetical protein